VGHVLCLWWVHKEFCIHTAVLLLEIGVRNVLNSFSSSFRVQGDRVTFDLSNSTKSFWSSIFTLNTDTCLLLQPNNSE
jgi:hypothetical protein